MEWITFKKVSFCFYWIFLLISAVISGCSGSRPAAQVDLAKVKNLQKSVDAPLPGSTRKQADIIEVEVNKDTDEERLPIGRLSPPAPSRVEIETKPPRITASETSRAGSRRGEMPEEKAPGENTGPKVVFNFDNADLHAVIVTIAEVLGINYIIDPNVVGKVTIHTAGGLYKKDLFSLFFKILEVNGLVAVKEGSLYRIAQLKDSARMPIETRLPGADEDLPPMEKIIIQIIPLQFMSTEEMVKLLTPFVSAGGTIASGAGSNTLLVVDTGANILKILRLVETFDVNFLEKVSYRVYPVKYLDVEDVCATLNEFAASYAEKTGNLFIKFLPITRLNTLFVVSSTPLVFDKIEEILRIIDVIDKEVAPKVYVYFVKNGEAQDLAGLLDSVFNKTDSNKSKQTKTKTGGSTAAFKNPLSKAVIEKKKADEAAAKAKAQAPAAKAPVTAQGGGAGSTILMGEVYITADVIRNALLIEAVPSDYRIIENILRQIDIMPRQVLIEATIAEITHESSRKLGMEWALGKGAAAGAASFLATIGSAGLSYSIGVTDKWYAELNALASKGLVNVISSPHVLASDNKEAKIDVSREIPVASGTTTIASSTVIGETSIQYRDTGVILSVTPHINDRGLVTMDVAEEVSDRDKDVNVAGENYPSFYKRTVTTTLTVRHGQTIAIGGLIKDVERDSISGVPCLIDIPVVRYLFGYDTKETEKVELIVLLTPRVVANLDDVDAVTDEFKQKTRSIVKRFFPQ
jgi:general secretion pathway protein D